jgi:hypothetical protein
MSSETATTATFARRAGEITCSEEYYRTDQLVINYSGVLSA